MSEKTTLHLITHTHWDREWYQPFQAFRIRLVHLMDRLLAIFETDPQFQYFMLDGQTIVLEDYLAVRPEREEQIRSLIKSGRLLIGPWYILPDEFLVSPEAIIRNLLEGRRICRDFGGYMQVGYIPDPFGHIGQMPQILHGFGIKNACFWRGLDDEPCEIIWSAPDGSQVLTSYLRESYSNATGLPMERTPDFLAECSRLGSVLAKHAQSHHLLLMNGTDHAEPSLATSARLAEGRGQLEDFDIIHSTLPVYFEALQAEMTGRNLEFPHVQGELRASRRSPLLPGVLSSRMWIKQRNHACQNLLERWAEPFNAWATILHEPDPLTSAYIPNRAALIHQAWRLLLQCHPHDSICGCSIDQVHEEMRSRFDQVEQIAEEVTQQSLEMISSQVNLKPPHSIGGVSGALLVFNPSQSLRSDRVEAVFNLPEGTSHFEIIDDGGKLLPYQLTGSGGQELFNATLDRESFLNSFGMIKEGNIAGMTIQALRVEQQGTGLEIDVTLSDDAQPNMDAWNQGQNEIKKLMADERLISFHAYAHYLPFLRFFFLASDVPGLGYRTFWVRALPAKKRDEQPLHLSPWMKAVLPLSGKLLQSPLVSRFIGQVAARPKTKPVDSIDNEFLKISIDPKSGTLNLYHKRSGVTFSGLNRFVDGGDRGDTYNFCPPENDHWVNAQVRSIQYKPGEVESVIDIEYRLFSHRSLSPDRGSRSPGRVMIPIRSRISLVKGAERVEISTEIDNQAFDHRLRVHFPLPFRIFSAVNDGHFERVNRPVGIPAADNSWVEKPRPEVPQRRYTLVAEGAAGFLLAARGLPEVETASTESGCQIRLTLLRCVGWLSRDDLANRKQHAGPGTETPGAQMSGKHVFEYALIPFLGTPQAAIHEAQSYDLPLKCLTKKIQAGPLSPINTLVETNPEFELTCIKTAEDGNGIIVRGYQPVGGQVMVSTSMQVDACQQVRLDESELGKLEFDQSRRIAIPARDWEIISLKWSKNNHPDSA